MIPTNWTQNGHVCLTANQEWLIDRAVCVAVRDRSSDEWLEDHFALDERVDLVPRNTGSGTKCQWDLQVSTFGLTLQMGPVLAIHPALETLMDAHRTRQAG